MKLSCSVHLIRFKILANKLFVFLENMCCTWLDTFGRIPSQILVLITHFFWTTSSPVSLRVPKVRRNWFQSPVSEIWPRLKNISIWMIGNRANPAMATPNHEHAVLHIQPALVMVQAKAHLLSGNRERFLSDSFYFTQKVAKSCPLCCEQITRFCEKAGGSYVCHRVSTSFCPDTLREQ